MTNRPDFLPRRTAGMAHLDDRQNECSHRERPRAQRRPRGDPVPLEHLPDRFGPAVLAITAQENQAPLAQVAVLRLVTPPPNQHHRSREHPYPVLPHAGLDSRFQHGTIIAFDLRPWPSHVGLTPTGKSLR